MIDAVTTRLTAQVPELSGRIDGAAEFTALMSRGGFPTATPTAYLLPLGLLGGTPSAMSGAFIQDYAETLGVVLLFSSNDRTGEAALKRLRTIIFEVVEALVGWAPADELGVFRFTRGGMVSVKPGHIAYQLDFSITDQLRIAS